MKISNYLSLFAGILLILTFCIFLSGTAVADFNLGRLQNSSDGYDIETQYSPGGNLRGAINISITNEPFDSKLMACFDSECDEISIKDFLDNNADAGYNCTTSACSMSYTTSGSGDGAKTLNFASGEEKMIGFKITGSSISSITGFSLSISSNAGISCSNPLKIDVLNDGSYEWIAYKATNNFCSSDDDYGCYEPSQKDSEAYVTLNQYCSKIKIGPASKVKIGANLTGTASNTDFVMSIFNEDYNEVCEFSVSSSGEYGCVVYLNLAGEQEFDVCINAKTSSDSNEYTLGMENHNPCGYISDEKQDFSIFAKPGEYDPLGNFILSTEELQSKEPALGENTDMESYIINYLDSEYDSDCSASNGCIIPVRIVSGASQEIIFSNAALFYESASGVSAKADKLYAVSKSASLINIPYAVLDLSQAILRVPKKYGDNELDLTLGSKTIADDFEINVVEAPIIDLVYPQKIPAAINIAFRAYTTGSNVTKYIWNFGDNTSAEETAANKIIHKYTELGTYELSLNVESALGESARTFTIKVLSPEDYMEDIFKESQKNIDDVRTQTDKLNPWIKSYFDSKLNLNGMEAEMNKLKADFEASGGSTSEYVNILNSLDALDIPSSLEVTDSSSAKFLIDRGMIDINALKTLGAGEPKDSSEEAYKDAVFEWFDENFNALIEGSVYSLYIDGAPKPLASKFKLTLSPKKDSVNDVYFVINEAAENIKLEDNSLQTKTAGKSTGVLFSSLGSKEIEFILPQEIDIIDVPAYLSPAFSKLSQYAAGAQIDICNNNGICDAEENWKNCRADCKPVGLISLWLVIMLFVALCIYIALQEWYKRKYENWLFRDKNDLFNLINFMDNAEKQGLKKEEIFRKLEEKKWIKEQMNYAWNKYKGLRTGMWEIPVFNVFEKMRVKKEIEKRRKAGMTGSITPIPHALPPIPVKPFSKILATGGPIKPVSEALTSGPAKPVAKNLPSGPVNPISKNLPVRQNINKPASSLSPIKKEKK